MFETVNFAHFILSKPANTVDKLVKGTMSREGFLLVVTTNSFPIGKWGEVSDSTGRDHEQVQYLLSHNLIGKFHPDNVTVLKNASASDFKDALGTIKRQCTEYNFLVVYLATHVITVVKGEKKQNAKEVCYFAFHDSVWGKPPEIAESCVSLSAFSALLNKIHCSRKTVIVNYAHQPKPRTVLFPSSKILYPPADFLGRLSELAKCVVIGSCSIGAKAKDYLVHSEYHLQQDFHAMTISNDAAKNAANTSTLSYLNPFRRTNKAKYERVLTELMKEWGCKPFSEVSKSARPVKPTATWEMGEDGISITLPDNQQRNNYTRRLIYWSTKRTLAKPVNFTMQQARAHMKQTFRSPCQVSLVDPREADYTVFGRAVVNALRGGACKPASPLVTALDFYTYVFQYMQKTTERITLANAAEYNPESELPAPVPVYQTPVMFTPVGHGDMVNNPICMRCEPPIPPERPYIIRIGENEIMLEWYNPPCDGIAPFKYKLAMKNVTRNFSTWSDVYYPGDIVKTRFLVRNLPMGIACQFRVAAFNNGGWGEFSEPTTHVIPGEQHQVLPDALRWKRIRQGGTLAVLDRLESHSHYHSEYEVGLRLLLGAGQNAHGFKNSATIVRVTTVALEALRTYNMDPDIAAYAFTLIGLCLRTRKTNPKVRQLIIADDLAATVGKYLKYFRRHPQVMGGISFLRGGIKNYLPSDPEQDLQTLIPPPGGNPEAEGEEEEIIVVEEEEEEEEEDDQGV